MTSRYIVWALLVGLILYDIVIDLLGKPTLSKEIRVIDIEMGGLICVGWAALWFHFFVLPYLTPWANK